MKPGSNSKKSVKDVLKQKSGNIGIQSNLYRSLFYSCTKAMLISEPLQNSKGEVTDLKILDINPAFEIETGIPADNIKENLASLILPYLVKKTRLTNYSELLKNGPPITFSQYIRTSDKHFEVNAFCPSEKTIAFIYSGITTQKQPEGPGDIGSAIKLTKSEERFATAFFNNPNGMIITTIDHGILEANENFLKMMGLTKEEVIGKNSVSLNLLPDPLKRDEAIELIKKYGCVRNFEVQMKSREGEMKTVIISIDKMPMEDGEGYLTVFQDITERRKAEEALQNNEEQYRILAEHLELERGKLAATIDNLPVGVGIEDPSGNTTFMNKEGLALHGFKSEQEMYSRLKDYVNDFEILYLDGRVMPVEEWPVSRALKGEYVENYELILRNRRNSKEKILSYTVVPVISADLVVLYVYVFRDLTDKKRAEDSLRDSEENFRTLADSISQLAWMADNKGRVFWYNKRWYDYTGYTVDEMMDSTYWRKVHHPLYVDRVEKKFIESVSNGTSWEDTFLLRSRYGEYRWFLSRALPVYDDSNNIIRWFGTNTDITEQKKLEEELGIALQNIAENESKLLSAQRLSNMGSFEIYPVTGEMTWSETLFEIFERDVKAGIPSMKEVINYFHPEDREIVQDALSTSLNRGERIEEESRIVLDGGKIKYLYTVISPYQDETRRPKKLLGAVMDITERKAAQLKLQDAYKQIEERLKEKEVLLRELYHRTKNNMQVISSLLRLKGAAFAGPDPEAVIEDMQKRIRSIALVHEKLYQSKNLSRVNLKEYIIDLAELLFESHFEEEKKVVFRPDLEDISVLIDTAVPCGLIITELVINSLKHGFPGDKTGYLEIILKRIIPESIMLVVADNGVGMQKEIKDDGETSGLQLFKTIAEHQLDAVVKLDTSTGVRWEIVFKDVFYTERV